MYFIHITQIYLNQNLLSVVFRKPNVEIHNLQPSQILTRPLPSLPYSSDTQQFLKKFKFQNSYVTDDEYLKLCSILVKYRNCYAAYKNDVGQMATPFRIRLKPNSKLQTQRLIHYREKLKKLLDELEKTQYYLPNWFYSV